MNTEEHNAFIKELKLKAHEFTRELIPLIAVPATTEALRCMFNIIESERTKIELEVLEDMAGASDEDKNEIAKKAFAQFVDFQTQMVTVATQNVRLIVWNLVGSLTADYFPDLADENKKERQETNGNQAQDSQTIERGSSLSQSDSEVDSGESLPESQSDSLTPRPSGFRESAASY